MRYGLISLINESHVIDSSEYKVVCLTSGVCYIQKKISNGFEIKGQTSHNSIQLVLNRALNVTFLL